MQRKVIIHVLLPGRVLFFITRIKSHNENIFIVLIIFRFGRVTQVGNTELLIFNKNDITAYTILKIIIITRFQIKAA